MTVHSPDKLRDVPRVGVPGRHTAAGRLAALAAAGALAAGCAGLLMDNPYPGAASTAAMLQGYDAVNVLVALALAAVVRPARRGRMPAVLAQASLLAYLVYTYAYYLFGTGFGDLFLLHVLVFSAGAAGLAFTVRAIDLPLTGPAATGTRSRIAAALLAVLATALAGMWVYFALDNAITGDVAGGSRLVETDTVVHLGIALDLALLVPWYATAAVLLWRHRPAGYPAAVIALVSGLLHQLSYIVALPVQVAADISGATAIDPGEPAILLLYGTALALLLTGHRRRLKEVVR
ncbi:hypothetical protein [Kribbella sp. HUAS MG21]|jgi:hypothetical protein|uniref:Uncharacterized protein n=1 Tax=Kribbella sp. HUAS MG21 TaxID=3160966 RepID=A0AAU7T7N9_9ACTN